MKRIGVFCSASSDIDSVYLDAAASLGKWLGENHKTLVYGGAFLGLMEVISMNTYRSGGKVIGVLPKLLLSRSSQFIHRTITTENLSDRKDIIIENSDILVALPGGIGTLDEIFHTLAAATLSYHHKKLIFYNINGYYTSLISSLSEFKKRGFISSTHLELYEVANTESELKTLLI